MASHVMNVTGSTAIQFPSNGTGGITGTATSSIARLAKRVRLVSMIVWTPAGSAATVSFRNSADSADVHHALPLSTQTGPYQITFGDGFDLATNANAHFGVKLSDAALNVSLYFQIDPLP